MMHNLSDLKQDYPEYSLKKFEFILAEIIAHFPNFPELPELTVIELGPGPNLNLLRFIRDHSQALSVTGIGLTKASFWQKKRLVEDDLLILDSFILPALRDKKPNSVDLIISRHVLEQHSIEAAILLKNPRFRHAIRNNQFGNLPESFPASVKNIQVIFGECYRILKPGGVIITQVAKKKYRVLIQAGLEAFKPAELTFKDIGKFSEISTFVK